MNRIRDCGEVALERLAVAGTAVLVAVPFLFPWVAGPSSNVPQWLASGACAALLIAFAGFRGHAGLAWGLFCAGLVSAALGLLQYYGLADAPTLPVFPSSIKSCPSSQRCLYWTTCLWAMPRLAGLMSRWKTPWDSK